MCFLLKLDLSLWILEFSIVIQIAFIHICTCFTYKLLFYFYNLLTIQSYLKIKPEEKNKICRNIYFKISAHSKFINYFAIKTITDNFQ